MRRLTPGVARVLTGIPNAAFYLWMMFRSGNGAEETQQEEETKTFPNWLSVLMILGGLGGLILGGRFFVNSATAIAQYLNLSEKFIAITIMAAGTSLPELAASLAAAVKKNTQLALGNIVGSNIFNITLILGLSSQVMPLTSSGITIVDYLVMIGASILPLLFGFRGKIGRLGGALMVICFIAYNWYLITNQIA